MRQFDSVSQNDSQDRITVSCMCGSLECGNLVISRVDYDDTFYYFYQFEACPTFAYHTAWKRLKARVNNAWRVFGGYPISVDLEIVQTDAHKIANFLHNAQNESYFLETIREDYSIQDLDAAGNTLSGVYVHNGHHYRNKRVLLKNYSTGYEAITSTDTTDPYHQWLISLVAK